MKGFLIIKKEAKKELNIVDLSQENYKIETVKDIFFALKDLFKNTLQQMMNKEFDRSMGYQNMIIQKKKL